MGKFLNPKDLKANLYRIFKEAEKEIIIISPFIQLSDELRTLLRPKQKIKDFQISILYGKNERDPSKSLNPTDFRFFSEFKNHEILYNPNLHAKKLKKSFEAYRSVFVEGNIDDKEIMRNWLALINKN
jgi:hypothetical protein